MPQIGVSGEFRRLSTGFSKTVEVGQNRFCKAYSPYVFQILMRSLLREVLGTREHERPTGVDGVLQRTSENEPYRKVGE
ncbi:hypothetical protein BH20ACT11_BH20ACT11_15690 [soil metagenome]